ncbi:ABC transporter substrate-binding protein [Phocoenobacter uteri]|nr:ABC transporter substrate-binding protein [Phocoenobacter uteri]
MEWQLDEIASSELIYEMKISDNESETREKITQEMVQTAILNHYFSYLYDEQNQPIKYTTHPKNTYFEITDNRVTFHIHFYLTHPQQVQDRIFKLFTYEPSYYISMSYEDENALLISDSDHLCKLHLNPPNVDTEIQQYAMDLDRTQTPDQDLSLGAQFAQEVKIVCKK